MDDPRGFEPCPVDDSVQYHRSTSGRA
jgi:hypothetical protein